jgi:hypothetical protein
MSTTTQYVKVIVYDLGSENLKVFENTREKELVRCARVKCVQLLHNLGIQCTESVILIAPSNVDKVDRVIARVKEIYDQLNDRLVNDGFNVVLKPIIQVLDLTQVQTSRLLPLAHRRLVSLIDRTIDNLSSLIDNISSIDENTRKRKVRRNIMRLASAWRSLYDMARELGIDITRDYNALVDMIEEALAWC